MPTVKFVPVAPAKLRAPLDIHPKVKAGAAGAAARTSGTSVKNKAAARHRQPVNFACIVCIIRLLKEYGGLSASVFTKI